MKEAFLVFVLIIVLFLALGSVFSVDHTPVPNQPVPTLDPTPSP